MAKKGDRRIEPTFDRPAKGKPSRDLSVSDEDRVVPARRAKPAPARKTAATRARRGKTGRSSLIGGLGRLAYWGFVLAIWCGIATAGVVVYYGAKMPAATTWSIPDRSPNIKIVSVDGQPARQSRHDGRRGGRAARDVALHPAGGHGHRGPALLFAFRRRPGRPRPRHGDQPDSWPLHAGRLDADAAACQEPVPEARPHAGTQGAGGAAGALARAQAFQGPDSRNVPEPGLFRFGRLWRRGGVAALFRQVRARRHAGRGGASRRPAQGAVAGFRRRAIPRPRTTARNWCSPPCARRR